MSVLRRHIILLDSSGSAPHTGVVHALVPSDSDLVPDSAQAFVALVSVSRPVVVVSAPAIPVTPIEVPGASLRAGVPAAPLPSLPGSPSVPSVPGRPSLPGGPAVPGTPSTPGLPSTPGIPSTPTPVPTPVPTGGSVVVDVEGSFDQLHWASLGSLSLAAGASSADRVVELGAVPPYVRARVSDAAGAVAFDWTAYVALGSSGAFRARVT